MTEWKTYKLGELVEKITKGTTPSTLGGGFVESGINFIKSEAVGYDGRIDKSTFVFITEETNEKLKRSQLKEGDILFSMAGIFLGKNAIVTKDILPANTNQALAIIRLKKETTTPIFVHYYLRQKDVIKKINSMSGQSAQPNINFEEIKSIEIILPDLATQTQIAQILSSLDDKIELNLQMNQALEAMAQAIFKEWFVNFNFPNFDGELENGLPTGWKVIELSKLISVKDGTHDSPKQSENGKFLITSKHLKNHFIDFESAYRISEEDFEKINKRSKVDKLDVLVTMIGTVGNLYFVHDEVIDFAIKNIGLFKTSENPDLAYFLYFTISSKEISDYFIKRLAGSTQQYLTLETLRQTPIVFPDDKTLKSFNDFAKNIYHKIEANSQNIQTLTQTRDALLPKLMSGKITIEDAKI